MKRYSFQKYNPETMARAVGNSVPVSTKHCIEITARIRRKTLEYAKKHLTEVIEMKRPLIFTKYTGGVGHKRGMRSGRYPIKACKEVLKLVESCEANAQFKGLNTSNMIVIHSNAHFGSRQYKSGRQRRRTVKRTHIEIVLEEKGKSAGEIKEAKTKIVKEESREAASDKVEQKTEKAEKAKKIEKHIEKQNEKPVQKRAEKPVDNHVDKKEVRKELKPEHDKSEANHNHEKNHIHNGVKHESHENKPMKKDIKKPVNQEKEEKAD